MRPALRHIADFQDLAAGLVHAVEQDSRTCAVTHLQLRSCEHLTDATVACLLGSVPTLRSLDFSNCGGITDASMRRIAQHDGSSGVRATQGQLGELQIGTSQVGPQTCHRAAAMPASVPSNRPARSAAQESSARSQRCLSACVGCGTQRGPAKADRHPAAPCRATRRAARIHPALAGGASSHRRR